MVCEDNAKSHSDRRGLHRLNSLSRRYLFPSRTLQAWRCKSYYSSFCHISYDNLNTLMVEATSKGRIYSHLEISSASSLSYEQDDFFLPVHTYQENDWFSNMASFSEVVRKIPHRLTSKYPNLLHHNASTSFCKLSFPHILLPCIWFALCSWEASS